MTASTETTEARGHPIALGWGLGAGVGFVAFLLVQLTGPPDPSAGRELSGKEFRSYVEVGEASDRRIPRLVNLRIYPGGGMRQVAVGTLVADKKPDEAVFFSASMPFNPSQYGSVAADAFFRAALRGWSNPQTHEERAAIPNWSPTGPVSSVRRETYADLQEYLTSIRSKPAFTYGWWREPLAFGGILFGILTVAASPILAAFLIALEERRVREANAKRLVVPGPAPAPRRAATGDLDRELDAMIDPDARR